MNPVIFIPFIFLSIFILIILHEIGHGLLAGFFTTKDVKIFIGSYGKTENNFKFKLRQYHFHIEYNIFKWRGGLCIYSPQEMSFPQHILQILAGSFFPLIIAILFYFVSKEYLHEYLYGCALIFLVVSSLSLIQNLYPRKNAVRLQNGILIPNDGYLFMELIKYSDTHKDYAEALNLYCNKEYEKAAEILVRLIPKRGHSKNLYRFAISSCIISKKTDFAKSLFENYLRRHEPLNDDLINIGVYYNTKGEHNKAFGIL